MRPPSSRSSASPSPGLAGSCSSPSGPSRSWPSPSSRAPPDARTIPHMRLLEKIRRLRFRSLDRGELTDAEKRPVENIDALAAIGISQSDLGGVGGSHNSIPPNYVKSYDE